MKTRSLIIPVILLVFFLSLAFSPYLVAAKKNQQEKNEEEETIIIPEEIRSALKQGLAQRQGRQDIPFSLAKHLFLPARENIHSIFLFKMKNQDIGFTPLELPPIPEKKEGKEKKTETPPEAETEKPPAPLQTSLEVFLQFHRLEKKEPAEIFKEIYIPLNLQAEGASYDPEKEEIYSTAYPLPPGDYLLAMAVASLDLQRIGTLYYEFSLPDLTQAFQELDTTPIFFVKGMKRMASPEITAEIHKDFFTYSVLQIEPKTENVFVKRENLDIFYYIYGAQPKQDGMFDIVVNYEVLKDKEPVIRFEEISYQAPIISQPLPMKKTVVIKSEKEGEKKETRFLEPGTYTLSISIKDNVSGKSSSEKIDIEIK
ncbi:MAG: hypothetical protein ACETWK_03595 [Candidatus Aminicenantaceae bacterium]